MTRPTPQDTTSSLRRALSLLDAFTQEHTEMTVRELAERSGIPRSTTHRLVTDLLDWGGLERGTRGVRLGVKLFELGTMAPSQATLREAASPFLHILSEVTRLTANLAIREGGAIVYLDKIASNTLRVPHTRYGGRGTLHATALGKAILAFSDAEEVGGLVSEPLAAITPKTITSRQQLDRELATIKRSGAAFDVEESQLGLFCVAAPVRGARGTAIAAVSVTGATALSQAERFSGTVIATARAIERRLSSTVRA
jgi:DNA-binding IclR family transcriptional regulator